MKRSFKNLARAVIVAFALVSFWRGIWGLMDVYLFPNHPVVSLWISLIIGVILLFWTENLVKQFIF